MTRKLDFVDECYKDIDLSLLKKLTLVIPTYNRNIYLSRCLWYHAHFPFYQIIVADSSPEEKKIVNRNTVAKTCEKFGTDIVYLEYEPETEKYGGDIYRKWGDAILHVQSEYSEICTDREFVNPSVCYDSIQFLDENPDYVSASGKRLNAITDQSLKMILCSNMESTTDENPLNRLTYCCCNQHETSENAFHVNRANVHKIAQNNHLNHGINDIRYGEVVSELQYYLLGKIKISNSIGRIRDNSHIIYKKRGVVTKDESSSSRYPNPNAYPLDMQHELHGIAIECLWSLLAPNEQTETTKKIIEMDCNEIIEWWMNTNHTYSESTLKSLFWKHLPLKIKIMLSSRFGTGKYVKESDFFKSINSNERKFIQLIERIIDDNIT